MTRSTGTGNGPEEYDGWRLSQGMIPIDPLDYEWPLVPGGPVAGRLIRLQTLRRSQTMSTPSSPARTTLAGCCLSMWPTSPL